MFTVLFVTWDGGGNVPPALGIAAELKRRGNAVRFLGHPSQKAAIDVAGFEFEAYRHAKPWSVLAARSAMTAPFAYAAVFTDTGMGEDLVESVQRTATDRVVIDGLLVGAMAGAARAGIPYSVLVHTLYGVMFPTLTTGPLSVIARVKRINPGPLYASADRILAATLEELDVGSHAGVDYTGVDFTGPVVPRNLRENPAAASIGRKSASAPLVLVSLSTTAIAGQREALQRIIDALGGLPVRAVVTTGPAIDPAELRAPANAEMRRSVPHEQLMRQASLVISHGGHATAMLALAHDLPLLIIPMNLSFDQPVIGQVIAERNAGLALGKKATVGEVRAAVERMLADPSSNPYRQAAVRLGALVRSQNGAEVAAGLIAAERPCPARRGGAVRGVSG
ncbi:glycosyltransferase [Glaciibacter psychrotolerans]|uniref:UDP-N-acetylglucosamine:LPS N-acetylglucosamine transferase n=1 Tax=Glaciibacter psychrotolerans TaxID=670054 RepID=A0A7Z0J563_9MICO|nr:nucleotide disphospho-sugar-binding domain-containing protein [Leifsonia psychrotolerans]NYJ19070.1 UDP-N-acetylglucosamine:LPS N-acetylglucosamine transferase [Leifsonia psychrotolerans]